MNKIKKINKRKNEVCDGQYPWEGQEMRDKVPKTDHGQIMKCMGHPEGCGCSRREHCWVFMAEPYPELQWEQGEDPQRCSFEGKQ